jgi:hypothetical protein
VYEDIYDAKNALDSLQGFNVKGRYIVVLYHQVSRIQTSTSATLAVTAARKEEVQNPYL